MVSVHNKTAIRAPVTKLLVRPFGGRIRNLKKKIVFDSNLGADSDWFEDVENQKKIYVFGFWFLFFARLYHSRIDGSWGRHC